MVLVLLVAAVLAVGALSAAICMGIGALVAQALAIARRPLESFWFGLATVVALLEIYHLFRPVDTAIGVALLFAGFAGFIAERMPSALAAEIRRAGPWTCAIYAGVVGVIVLRCAGPCQFFDTGLYGAQTVRWIATYPAVPGLANLEGRFGFNSSAFLCMVLYRHGALAPLTFRVFDGLLLAVLFAPVVAACLRLLSGQRDPSRPPSYTQSGTPSRALSEEWFVALLAMPLIYRLFESSIIEDLVGTDTDLSAMVLALAAMAYLFSALQSDEMDVATPGGAARRAKLLCAGALVALAATFKLSVAVLAGGCWVVGLWKWRSLFVQPRAAALRPGAAARRPAKAGKPGWLAYAAVPAAIVIPWMVHGVILSGYLFYPSTLFPLPVDWRIPAASAQLEAAGIQAWARLPHATLGEAAGWHWVGGWLRGSFGDRAECLFPILIILFGVLMIAARSVLRSRGSYSAPSSQPARGADGLSAAAGYSGLWLLVPMALALAFWFAEAPALRFGQAVLWGTACVLGGYGFALLVGSSVAAGRCALVVILLAAGWSLYPRTLWRNSFAPLLHVREFSPLPLPDVAPMESRYGVTVFVARTPGQDWDSTLPASEYLTPTLRLRRAGELRAGFSSDGLPPDAEWTTSASEQPPAPTSADSPH